MLHILTNSTLCHLRISFMLFLCHYTLFSRQLPLLKFHPSSSTSQNISEELCKSMENLFSHCPYVTSPKLSWLPRWLSGKKIHLPIQEIQETRVRSLDQEDPLEKEMATHSSTLAWSIPWTEETGGPQSVRLQRVRHNVSTKQQLNSLIKMGYTLS